MPWQITAADKEQPKNLPQEFWAAWPHLDPLLQPKATPGGP
jgi:hypothetical protein